MVTGGAGYIGAHAVSRLTARGDFVVVVDDLSTGRASRLSGELLVRLDVAHSDASQTLAELVRRQEIDAIIHFAAKKRVEESVQNPAWYYQQNLGSLANVIEAMAHTDCRQLIYSSSAAVYGDVTSRVSENHSTRPINPYGETKLCGEKLISSSAYAYGISAASLRYFNVAGSDSAQLRDDELSNLIPIVVDNFRRREAPQIYGADYPTVDGTCVRDFIHVADLADAHLAVLDSLPVDPGNQILNVGTGRPYSVREVISEIQQQFGDDYLEPVILPRRAGDPAKVVSDVAAIFAQTGWKSKFGLADIVKSTLESVSLT